MRIFRIFVCLLLALQLGFTFGDSTQPNVETHLLQDQEESGESFPFAVGKSPLEGVSGFGYFGVLLILLGLLAFLWSIKHRLNTPKIKMLRFFDKQSKGEVQICSITPLNVQHKLIVFEAYNKRYLVVLGTNSTALIDAYEIRHFKDMLEQDTQHDV